MLLYPSLNIERKSPPSFAHHITHYLHVCIKNYFHMNVMEIKANLSK